MGSPPTAEVFSRAGTLAVEGAASLGDNCFKVDLLRNAVVRALETVGGRL